jgi:hypothetical protein
MTSKEHRDLRGFGKRLKGLEPSTFCMASRRSSQLSYSREVVEYKPLSAAGSVWPRAVAGAIASAVAIPAQRSDRRPSTGRPVGGVAGSAPRDSQADRFEVASVRAHIRLNDSYGAYGAGWLPFGRQECGQMLLMGRGRVTDLHHHIIRFSAGGQRR